MFEKDQLFKDTVISDAKMQLQIVDVLHKDELNSIYLVTFEAWNVHPSVLPSE